MGLFDMFKSSGEEEMTPKLAFATSMLFMVGADGEIGDEEIGQLVAALGGDAKLLERAIKYARKVSLENFLQQAGGMLSQQQKLYILTNLCDSLLADGHAEPQEQALFEKFLQAFKISQEEFRPYFSVIAFKNDRNVLLG